MIFRALFLLSCSMFFSCDIFQEKNKEVVIARVNKNYLYEADIEPLINEGITAEDSALAVSNYINRWATQQLLIDQANLNISIEKQKEYKTLIEEYKNSLYAEAYKNIIINKELDTLISQSELETYYEAEKENFKLNGTIVKARYVYVDEAYNDTNNIKTKLDKFTEEDKIAIAKMQLEFKQLNLNDSVWIRKELLIENLPILKKSESVFNKRGFNTVKDSTGICFIEVVDLLEKNDVAPISFIKPTLKQIVLNRRKLELIKKLENDITRDALKNNKFEIYTKE